VREVPADLSLHLLMLPCGLPLPLPSVVMHGWQSGPTHLRAEPPAGGSSGCSTPAIQIGPGVAIAFSGLSRQDATRVERIFSPPDDSLASWLALIDDVLEQAGRQR